LESVKNIRLLSILSIALVSLILITSQSPVAFAGFVDKDNDGFENLFRECNESDTTCDPDDDDPCNPDPSSVSCLPSEKITEIDSDVKDGVVVGPDDIVVISNGATIDGNLEVNGGTVIITESSTIKGNIVSNGGTIVIKGGSEIDGNVDITVSGSSGVLEIDEAEIKGNLMTNGIDTLTVTDSNINGNIYSENDGVVTITGNTVNGNLEILGPSSCSESSNDVNGNNSGCP